MVDDLKITPSDVPVIFVNDVAGSGFANGNCNITFVTARFTPQSSGTVEPDLIISCRLRLDLWCAERLHEQLGKIIEQNTKGPAQSEKMN